MSPIRTPRSSGFAGWATTSSNERVRSPDEARPLLHAIGFSDYLTELLARTPGLAGELLGDARRTRSDVKQYAGRGVRPRSRSHDLSSPPDRESFVATTSALSELADECVGLVLRRGPRRQRPRRHGDGEVRRAGTELRVRHRRAVRRRRRRSRTRCTARDRGDERSSGAVPGRRRSPSRRTGWSARPEPRRVSQLLRALGAGVGVPVTDQVPVRRR